MESASTKQNIFLCTVHLNISMKSMKWNQSINDWLNVSIETFQWNRLHWNVCHLFKVYSSVCVGVWCVYHDSTILADKTVDLNRPDIALVKKKKKNKEEEHLASWSRKKTSLEKKKNTSLVDLVHEYLEENTEKIVKLPLYLTIHWWIGLRRSGTVVLGQ